MIQWQAYIQRPRQGIFHKRRENSPCQDKAAVKKNNEVIVAVLSDGLGSLEYSGIAAEVITSTISTYLLNYDYRNLKEDSLKADILYECKRAMNKCSDKLNLNMSKMDCTLLFVVLFKNRGEFIFGQLGDGAICAVKQNQGFLAIAQDDNIKASSNLTKTVLSSDALDYFNLRIYHTSDIVGIFLTTDGLENELYSKAGTVKKKLEWYLNLISNNDKYYCDREIQNRWDELTSDEKYGFTDDMSLVAIVQPNIEIKLPEEANWLCICGHRNRMESSRCESCEKDFLKVYKGLNFKEEYGSKQSFFNYINGHPQEERRVLQKYCTYTQELPTQLRDELPPDIRKVNLPVSEPLVQRENALGQNHRPSTWKPTRIEENRTMARISANTVSPSQAAHVQVQQPLKRNSQGHQSAKALEANNRNGREKKSSKNKFILAYLLLAFIFGIFVHAAFNNSKTENELQSLQRENKSLQFEKESLEEKIAILNTKMSELENAQNVNIKLSEGYDYYIFDNGDMYIGQMNQGLPSGIGVVYSFDKLMTGYFKNGEKNGEFFILYDDGRSKVRIYDNDIRIPETQSQPNETIVP